MKKIFLICLLFSIKSYSQDLSGITVNLTLRAGDWAFIAGAAANIDDSTSIVYINRLRDTMLLANPANFNVNVRFNSIAASVVYKIYAKIKSIQSGLGDNVGTNISTQIKAIANTPLQNALTALDNFYTQMYQDMRRKGKNFLSDH